MIPRRSRAYDDPGPTRADLILIVLAFALVVMRMMGVKHEAFQAVAHLFVGGLFGAWLVSRPTHGVYLWVALALPGVELLCFLAGLFA